MTSARAMLGPLLVLSMISCTSCDKPQEAEVAATDEKKDEPPPTNIKVDLPPPPNFDEGKAPNQWEDGSWSIYGLREKLDENVKEGEAGKEVQVKGWIQEIYVPPPCPEGEVCPPPKQPHVWITDNQGELGKKRAMMVVNYRFTIPDFQAKMWKDAPPVVLEKDKRYTFRGKFKQFSDTGFAYDRGLIEFVAYKPLDPKTGAESAEWVYPPGAAWHPIMIAEQEAQNAELAEKAKGSAVKQP